ncbi:arrestin domain-containing protein 17-like isoform X2 [Belonocnema kinseyi]|uniref:arrestin domain-containing protein 17-like isoform X2 n=1 Tax=Belonocnema kinseyi TaxID=2817044 RepID=UPI00143E0198|nr:arrestin domain-containing protein 17-like isoform X2 [Belonocnema kinseyi]
MGLKEFKIFFNNPYKVYYAGETIKARILVVLDSPKRIRGITVKIIGEANTDTRENQRQRTRWKLKSNKKRDDCSDHEVYLSITYSIFEDSSDVDEELELSPGEHLYPFEYVLPPDLPSSLESDLGHIRYRVESTIDQPWNFDEAIKETITVFSNYDLNTDCRASESVVVEGSKTFITCSSFGCCYPSPPLLVNYSLPVRGYVPGQTIPIKVNIKNESGVEVSSVKLSLEKCVTHRINRPGSDIRTNCKWTTVAEVSTSPLEHNRIVSFKQILKVPPLPPSNLNHHRIIDVKYSVILEVFVNGWCRKNLKIDTPVIIGTVPLSNYQSLAGPPKQNYPRKDPAVGWNSVTSVDAKFSQSAPNSSTSSSSAPNIIPNSSTTVDASAEDSSLQLPPQSYDEREFSKT